MISANTQETSSMVSGFLFEEIASTSLKLSNKYRIG